MQRPEQLKTRIFLDSGSAEDTEIIVGKFGFLDGQTTNPTYFVKKNPEVSAAVAKGKKFSKEELLAEYKKLAEQISSLVPVDGSVSVEVYADKDTTFEEMIEQGRQMWEWIPNAHIKLPIIPVGLEAAHVLVGEGKRVNMTLCFSQEQAAAVHAATRGAKKGQVFVSPFISRLDKIGQDGFSLLQNIQKMYRKYESHAEILAASVHSVYDIARTIQEEIDIITSPYDDFLVWLNENTPFSTEGLEKKDGEGLVAIEYVECDLNQEYTSFDIHHELTDIGLGRFASDWNEVLE